MSQMSQSLRKVTGAMYSLASLDAGAVRTPAKELQKLVLEELHATPNVPKEGKSPLMLFAQQADTTEQGGQRAPAQRVLADLELFLRSKRVHSTLQERYNPMYGMSEKDRIQATARRVGLNVPKQE